MTLIALGINHNTAPVDVREKVAFSPDELVRALEMSRVNVAADEMVILSTCNRTELYAKLPSSADAEQLLKWLADFHSVDESVLKQHAYLKNEAEAINHLMRVACGLDSLILGEPQILGQVKQAFAEAKNAGCVKTEFEKLFQHTFSVAKRVRSDTDIGANAVSVAFAAVQLAKQIFSDLDRSRVLLIGAGETIELVAKHLVDGKVNMLTVANRTLARAQSLAEAFAGKAITISQIPSHLAHADIVISSTASSLPLIGQGMVEQALKARKHKPMLLIDLAVPRDIESSVMNVDDAYLYTVDDLQNIVEQNVANREVAAAQAETIIASQLNDFQQWQAQYQQIDVIKSYRDIALGQRDRAVERALKQLQEGKPAEQVVSELAFKLTQSMLHGPTKALQQASKTEDEASLRLLSDALGLSPPKS